MGNLEDQIADRILDQFDALPAKYKPARSDAGVCSWVPLSGIVITQGDEKQASSLFNHPRILSLIELQLR